VLTDEDVKNAKQKTTHDKKEQDVVQRNYISPMAVHWGTPTVQPPDECFRRSASDGFVVVSANSGGILHSLVDLTCSGFDFQHEVSY